VAATRTESVASMQPNLISLLSVKVAEKEIKEKRTVQIVPGPAKNGKTEESVAPEDPPDANKEKSA
jgi:hypothetical protein